MKRKEFISNSREEIEAELLRLMRDPKCYAVVTQEIYSPFSFRIIVRVSPGTWQSHWITYSVWLGIKYKLSPSFFSIRPRTAKHIASYAARHSGGKTTLIHGEFEK